MWDANNQPPRFSVVIPTFNRVDLLKETIASIKKQAYQRYEVIVVDDGSTDGTLAWLAKNEPGISVVRQNRKGPGAARNAGARIASGAYLAFLDSDDLWLPWTLQAYDRIISEVGNPAFVAGRQHLFENSRSDCLDILNEQGIEMQCFRDYFSSSDAWRWWGASSFVVQKEVFLRVGGFSELNVYAEDADLALRLGVEKGFVQVLNPVTFAYRRHGSNSMNNLKRIIQGAWLLIRSERQGAYPGGRARLRQRLEIITRHIRPTVFACLNSGDRNAAIHLYKASLWWNLRLLRVRYLFAFPLLLALSFLRRKRI
ncbi:MAG TPA: glycosyltransferase [Bradyrhizobium sp.]|nr:glycosyltransferase [Bradyrhizobium sp.]